MISDDDDLSKSRGKCFRYIFEAVFSCIDDSTLVVWKWIGGRAIMVKGLIAKSFIMLKLIELKFNY